MDSMFSDPGKKLKKLALIIFWVVLVSSAIEGIALIYMGVNWFKLFRDFSYRDPLIIAGLLTPLLGVLTAWLSTIVLYAFGQLTEDTAAIREAVEKEKEKV